MSIIARVGFAFATGASLGIIMGIMQIDRPIVLLVGFINGLFWTFVP